MSKKYDFGEEKKDKVSGIANTQLKYQSSTSKSYLIISTLGLTETTDAGPLCLKCLKQNPAELHLSDFTRQSPTASGHMSVMLLQLIRV